MRTGILGGTFDPIHIGHLHAAESARHQLSLDRVLIIPAGDPWQKSGRTVSPSRHRLAMCRLAVRGVPGLVVDDREVDRHGPSYTIDTLETFPENEKLFLIVGADAAAGIDTWHRYEDILAQATLAVVPRPESGPVDRPGVIEVEMGLLEISGTDIRARVQTGRPFRFLVAHAVHDYIVEHDLYTDLGGDDILKTQ